MIRVTSMVRARSVRAVAQAFVALLLGAVRAAVDRPAGLHAVADDAAAAVRADGGERVDRAFEGVESPRPPARDLDRHRGVVLVAADIASRHARGLPERRAHCTAGAGQGRRRATASPPAASSRTYFATTAAVRRRTRSASPESSACCVPGSVMGLLAAKSLYDGCRTIPEPRGPTSQDLSSPAAWAHRAIPSGSLAVRMRRYGRPCATCALAGRD